MTVLVSLLPIKVANTSVLHNNAHVIGEIPYFQDLKSLTLRLRSGFEWGGDHVAISFANKGG